MVWPPVGTQCAVIARFRAAEDLQSAQPGAPRAAARRGSPLQPMAPLAGRERPQQDRVEVGGALAAPRGCMKGSDCRWNAPHAASQRSAAPTTTLFRYYRPCPTHVRFENRGPLASQPLGSGHVRQAGMGRLARCGRELAVQCRRDWAMAGAVRSASLGCGLERSGHARDAPCVAHQTREPNERSPTPCPCRCCRTKLRMRGAAGLPTRLDLALSSQMGGTRCPMAQTVRQGVWADDR